MADSKKKIGIVGSGLIGRSWAMLFASGGYPVVLFDTDQKQVEVALGLILDQMKNMEADGTLRGTATAAAQHKLITGVSSLAECLAGAWFVQECVPESLPLKKQIFGEMDLLVGEDTILSSSTSCILPSAFTETLAHRHHCLVSHPVNPPYFVPLVEIVPAPWTKPEAVASTRKLMEDLGQKPVTFSREIEGFGLNRIQYAILNECHHMVSEGLLNAADVDTLMTAGLGPRYAWMGPLETAHLNAEGTGSYCERYGATINRISATLKGPADWTLDSSKTLVDQMNQRYPVDTLQDRRKIRDEKLSALAKLRTQQKE